MENEHNRSFAHRDYFSTSKHNDRKTQNAKNRRLKNLLFSTLQALSDNLMLAAHGNIVSIFIKKEVG